MTDQLSVAQLWLSISTNGDRDQQADLNQLPEPAQRYLKHAIAPDARPATAIRVWMEGQIKLNDWLPFTAEQVIDWQQGFVWQASVKMRGLPIRGSDRLWQGQGAMRWKLLGLIPVMTADGQDITRSAAGRVAAESIWLPWVLRSKEVTWTSSDAGHPKASFSAFGEWVEMELTIDDAGRLQSIWLPRWGNPEKGPFHYEAFGAYADAEQTFDGYTVPTKLRAGWYFGEDRFDSEGEFFRATINKIEYK
jgi:hypothetical protein